MVKDSLEVPLSYANVIAKPKDVSKNIQFTVTDEEGFYKLIFQKGDTLTINISYLGYQPLSYEFIAVKSKKKNFVLRELTEKLDEIVIDIPVTVKGDNI